MWYIYLAFREQATGNRQQARQLGVPHQYENCYNLLKAVFAMLYGSVFVLAGLTVMLAAGELATLTCQRVEPTQGSCQLVTSGLFGSDEITIPLNQLQSAKLVSSNIRKSSYSIVLLTDHDKVHFVSKWNTPVPEEQRKADLINAFIGNPRETSLRIQKDDPGSAYIGGIFILFGGLVALHKMRE
jgi:hypothetical protein